MFRLNLLAQSLLGPPAGLPFTDPRYGGLPPALPPPPPPISLLYSSPPPPPPLLPEPLYRCPVMGFVGDELERPSPELKNRVGAEAGRMSSTSPQVVGRQSAQHPANYPSLLLHSQIEALRHYQQQQQQQQQAGEDAVAANNSESRSSCSTATASNARKLTKSRQLFSCKNSSKLKYTLSQKNKTPNSYP